jgi:hypothetical protein
MQLQHFQFGQGPQGFGRHHTYLFKFSGNVRIKMTFVTYLRERMQKHTNDLNTCIGRSDWNFCQATIDVQSEIEFVHVWRLEMCFLRVE